METEALRVVGEHEHPDGGGLPVVEGRHRWREQRGRDPLVPLLRHHGQMDRRN